jgi:hypothetical protein
MHYFSCHAIAIGKGARQICADAHASFLAFQYQPRLEFVALQ